MARIKERSAVAVKVCGAYFPGNSAGPSGVDQGLKYFFEDSLNLKLGKKMGLEVALESHRAQDCSHDGQAPLNPHARCLAETVAEQQLDEVVNGGICHPLIKLHQFVP
jgi:hypothetical protein